MEDKAHLLERAALDGDDDALVNSAGSGRLIPWPLLQTKRHQEAAMSASLRSEVKPLFQPVFVGSTGAPRRSVLINPRP
ncbi:hypothetical protein [Azospirillum lipoferum]|uniref:hypothetical protein n=1 Tax=Azospirillum lipoferum TaxID=193 RepID=UPI001395F92D|nr:hypothetical protein [Azospirillum lipoferum]